MNREIKFRAWDKATNTMLKPSKNSKYWNINLRGGCVIHEVWSTSDVELLQFTGLKDKKGRSIYDGDVLHNTKHGHKFIVQWGIEGESYAGWAGNWLGKDFVSPLFNGPLENCEIIGNIYEHPHLLK